jgi:hypothetical protein
VGINITFLCEISKISFLLDTGKTGEKGTQIEGLTQQPQRRALLFLEPNDLIFWVKFPELVFPFLFVMARYFNYDDVLDRGGDWKCQGLLF